MRDERKQKKDLIEELRLLRERVSQLEAIDQERRKSEKRKNAFVELGERLTGASSRKEAAQVIVDVAYDLFGWDSCYIVLYFEENHIVLPLLIMDTIDGERREFPESYITAPPGPIMNSVIKEGGRLILRDKDSLITDPKQPFGNTSRLSDSLMFVQIRKGQKVVGLLSIQSYTPNIYTESDLHLLQSLGDLCGGALERIQAEENLLRVHQIYRDAIVNANGVPYYFNYDNQRYDFIGEGCVELFEIQRKDFTFGLLKQFMKEIVVTDPEITCDPFEYFNAFRRGEIQKYRVDLRIVTHNYKERWISDCCVPIKNEETGEVIGSLGIFHDITERKQVENELKRIHGIYRKAIENAHGVPYILNFSNLSYDFLGEGCEELLGIPAKELSYAKWKSIVKEIVVMDKNLPCEPYEYGKQFRDGKTERFQADLKIVTNEGVEKWISDYSIPVRDEKTGKVIGSLGILQDVTDRKQIEETLKQSFAKLHRVTEGTINAISRIVEIRDPYTSGHQQRVAQLACSIAREMGLADEKLDAIHMSAVIHDIGKIYVPSEILSSPRRLTEIEYYILKTHPEVGYDILKSIEFPWPVAQIVLQHHERINGSGYPSGLAGDETLIEARIISVADVIEAMAYHRPYRPGLSIESALAEVEENKGILYDLEVADICLALFREKGFKFE
jgi:putative nucleotidyltransferase with HDIG domain